MEHIKQIIIHDIKFYEVSELIKINPKFFKGCRNGHDFITKRKIDVGYYTYASIYNNNWIFKDADTISKKMDKVLMSELWVDECFPKEAGEIIEDAPKIITLTDNEKMKNTKGDIINIEIRGKREEDKCYFKVHDIAIGFGMANLYHTVVTKKTYVNNEHYKYFNCKNNELDKKVKKIYSHKKQLFLTFFGFYRLIHLSKLIQDVKISFAITNWLMQFYGSFSVDNFVINFDMIKYLNSIGYTYCVTSPILDAIKIGFWRSTLESLRARYITVYGSDIELYAYETRNPNKLETKCHKKFAPYKITNELFQKKYLNQYVDFIQKNVEPI